MYANYEATLFKKKADLLWPKPTKLVKTKVKRQKGLTFHKGERYDAYIENIGRITRRWHKDIALQDVWKLKWQAKMLALAEKRAQQSESSANTGDNPAQPSTLTAAKTLWKAGTHNTPVRPEVLEAAILKHAPEMGSSTHKTAGIAPGFSRASEAIHARQQMESLVTDVCERTASGKRKKLVPLALGTQQSLADIQPACFTFFPIALDN